MVRLLNLASFKLREGGNEAFPSHMFFSFLSVFILGALGLIMFMDLGFLDLFLYC